MIEPGDLCFDIGAHEGDRTRIFRATGARVVAVEPQPLLVKRLLRSFRKDAGVVIEPVALSSDAGEIELHLARNAPTIATAAKHWTTGRFRGEAWEKAVRVPATTLDSIISKYGKPAFCKIDVEGYESTVLEGLSQALPCISFEFTIEFIEEAELCLRRLSLLGSITTNVSIGESLRFHFATGVPGDVCLAEINRLGLEDPELWGDIYVFSS